MYKPRIPALTDVTVCCDKSFEEFTNVMLPPRFFFVKCSTSLVYRGFSTCGES